MFGPEAGLRCSLDSNWPTRSLPNFKIAIHRVVAVVGGSHARERFVIELSRMV